MCSRSYITKLPVIEIDNFLTEQECDELLRPRIQKFEEAISHYPQNYRNNDRYVEDSPLLAEHLFIKLKTCLQKHQINIPDIIRLNERFRFCRYQEGQLFTIHQDGVYYPNASQASKYTFLLYLNDDFDGGNTEFYDSMNATKATKEIIPKKGKLVIFDHSIWHKGSIVTNQNKYILRSDIIITNKSKNTHHDGYIWSLMTLDKNKIISAGRDAYIKLWNKELELQTVFKIHTKSVIKILQLNSNYFISSSRDFTLKKWDIYGNVISSLCMPEMVISLIKLDDDTIVAGGTRGIFYVLSSNLELINKFQIHTNWIWDILLFGDNCLLSCCEDGSIHMTNLNTGVTNCIYSYHTPLLCMCLSSNFLYTGTKDGHFLVLNLENKKVEKYKIHNGAITGMILYTKTLYSCSEDNSVMSTNIYSKKTTKVLESTNFIQDVIILDDYLFAAGYDGIIHKIKNSIKRCNSKMNKNNYYESIKY